MKISKHAISLFYFLTTLAIDRIKHVFGGKRGGRLVILYYHGVPSLARQYFAAQMDMLKAASTVVTADYSEPLMPDRLYTAITFDDAFESVYENALPELEQRGIPATVFVPVGFLGKHPTWEMEPECPDRNETVMSEEKIRSLGSSVLRFGSHTVSHPRLSTLDDEALFKELRESKKRLEALLGMSVDEIAFPHGDFDERVIEGCRSVGFRYGYTIEPRLVSPTESEFIRGRVSVSPFDSRMVFFLKMNGAYRWLPAAAYLKRRLRRILKF